MTSSGSPSQHEVRVRVRVRVGVKVRVRVRVRTRLASMRSLPIHYIRGVGAIGCRQYPWKSPSVRGSGSRMEIKIKNGNQDQEWKSRSRMEIKIKNGNQDQAGDEDLLAYNSGGAIQEPSNSNSTLPATPPFIRVGISVRFKE